MRVKRSAGLVIVLEHDELVFHHYLSRKAFTASPIALDIIRQLHGWTEIEAVHASLAGYSRTSVVRSIEQLVELGVVVVEDSDAAILEDSFESEWLWGPLAAAYHFGSRNGVFITADDAHDLLRQQARFVPSPSLYTLNPDRMSAVELPLRRDFPEPFSTMAKRRTQREMLDAPITLEQLADCFLVSLAITAMIEDPDVVDLPLKMTPSGGARNPYEGYVCARRVDGLPPGSYHYSAMERTLGLVDADAPPPFADMLAGQEWATTAAAVIFLVANFERTMWKYHHSSAYRITMVEAGHIAQNICLAATAHGIVANPTGAISLDLVEETLGVAGVTRSVVYALVLGVPAPAARPV